MIVLLQSTVYFYFSVVFTEVDLGTDIGGTASLRQHPLPTSISIILQ